MRHLFWAQLTAIQRFNLALHPAQVKEQLLLRGRCAELHKAPRAQDIFLNRGTDPPHRIGCEAEAFIRIKLFNRLHQADIALGNHFRHGQAIAAIAHRNLRHEAQVRGNHFFGGF